MSLLDTLGGALADATQRETCRAILERCAANMDAALAVWREAAEQPPGDDNRFTFVLWFGSERAMALHGIHLEQVALPYARGHLDTWPDAVRKAPSRWVLGILAGERKQIHTLAKRLGLRGRRAKLLRVEHRRGSRRGAAPGGRHRRDSEQIGRPRRMHLGQQPYSARHTEHGA